MAQVRMEWSMATARITSKGQITVPKEVRGRLGVEPGDALDFEEERAKAREPRARRLGIDEGRADA